MVDIIFVILCANLYMTLIMCAGTTLYGKTTTDDLDGEFVVLESQTDNIFRVASADVLQCQHGVNNALTTMTQRAR